MIKKILILFAISLSTILANAQATHGNKFLHSLHGTYIELLSTNTCLNTKYDTLWNGEAEKYVGKEKAKTAVAQLIGSCQGTIIGETAVKAYTSSPENAKFCCSFEGSVKKITFCTDTIYGIGKNGEKIFNHKYTFVENDTFGNYIYESIDKNDDEFRFFWIRPDSPSETHHIEFRYGSEKEQLKLLTSGKYAYWMASGVREGYTNEYRNSIILFVKENLSNQK